MYYWLLLYQVPTNYILELQNLSQNSLVCGGGTGSTNKMPLTLLTVDDAQILNPDPELHILQDEIITEDGLLLSSLN